MASFFTHEELKGAELAAPFSFTKDLPVMKIGGHAKLPMYGALGLDFFQDSRSALFDLAEDPGQLTPIEDPDITRRFEHMMHRAMKQNDAPVEAFTRLGLTT